MVRSPLNWQQLPRRNSKFTAGWLASIVLLAFAAFASVTTAVAVEPNRPTTASSNGALGTGDALQLYRSCVFQAVVGACTQLIERSKSSGKTNAYPLAAAHYKRGSINAENKRLEAALKDYKTAAGLFPFPQLDLEIERLEKQLGKSRASNRAQPRSVQRKTVTAKRPKTSESPKPAAKPRQPVAKSRPAVKTANPTPTTTGQRKFALPTVDPAKADKSQRSGSAQKTIEWPERAARNGSKTSELWETITERVIHRYRVKSRPQPRDEARQVLADLRGSCVDETTSDCATLTDRIEIESAEFSSGIQNQSDFDQIRRTAGSTYSNLTTGSLPSFQAMSGLDKVKEEERPTRAPDPERGAGVVTSEMTLPAKTVKISMLDRPVLVTPIPVGKSGWSPSPMQITLVLIILSVSGGLLILYQQGSGLLSDMAGRLSIPTQAIRLPRLRRGDTTPVELADTVAVPSVQEGTPLAGTADSAPQTIETSPFADNQESSQDFTRAIAESLVAIDKPPELTRPPPLKPASYYSNQPASDPPQANRPEAHAVSDRLDAQQFDGSVLIVASDDEKRQRLLQSTLNAIAAGEGQSLRPLIALDSTGNLTKLLQRDEKSRGGLTIVDWELSQFEGTLNPFAMIGTADDPLARAQALSKTFEMQCHVCEGFLGSTLVAQSRSQLRHLFRLMTVTPKADFSTLRDLLKSLDASDYKKQIEDIDSKPMSSFFELEFNGRGFKKLSEKLVEKLDGLLANNLVAAAILEPKGPATKTKEVSDEASVLIVPVEQHDTSASSFMRRLYLAKAMQHGAFPAISLEQTDNTTLIVDSLSHFELPDALEFNQVLKDFLRQGGRIIAGVSSASDMPDGNCELVARSCSSKIIDSSLASQMHNISDHFGITERLLDVGENDGSEDQALLVRSDAQHGGAIVVTY